VISAHQSGRQEQLRGARQDRRFSVTRSTIADGFARMATRRPTELRAGRGYIRERFLSRRPGGGRLATAIVIRRRVRQKRNSSPGHGCRGPSVRAGCYLASHSRNGSGQGRCRSGESSGATRRGSAPGQRRHADRGRFIHANAPEPAARASFLLRRGVALLSKRHRARIRRFATASSADDERGGGRTHPSSFGVHFVFVVDKRTKGSLPPPVRAWEAVRRGG
jgi:hypothetical protein